MEILQKSVEEGATPLFLAVESKEWHDVVDMLQNDTRLQAATWVYSDSWKRLPLHEACRRQAPTWVIASLIAAYPAAVSSKTQFGELPLHLAVGCSASPEVVNLLLVSHWQGIDVADQSGRKPYDILEESEILDVLEHETVLDSLKRSQVSWNMIQQEHRNQLEALEKQHQEGMQAFQTRYDTDIAKKQSQVLALLQRVDLLERKLAQPGATDAALAKQIDDHNNEKMAWNKEASRLNRRISKLEEERTEAQQTRAELEQLIDHQQEVIKEGKKQQQALREALEEISSYMQRKLQLRVQATQNSIQKLYETFVDLEATVDQHENELINKLQRFGVKTLNDEEKNHDPDQDDFQDDDRMASEVLAAVSSVLHTGKKNTFVC
jgi:hypothetical protein